jgi:hypothetical protein
MYSGVLGGLGDDNHVVWNMPCHNSALEKQVGLNSEVERVMDN